MTPATVKIGTKEVNVPPLSLKQYDELKPERELLRSAQGGQTPDGWGMALAKILHASISRENSEITLEEVAASVDMRTGAQLLKSCYGGGVEAELEKKA